MIARTRALAFAAVAVLFGATSGAVVAACSDDPPVGAGSDAGLDEGSTPSDTGASEAAVDAAPLPKGDRLLGVGTQISDMDFPRDVQTVRDGGAVATTLGFAWDEVEGPYDAGADAGAAEDGGPTTQLFQPALHIANLVYSAYGARAVVTIDALDIGGSRAPAELRSKPLDVAELAARYDRVTDYALSQLLDTRIEAWLVASDVDVPLASDPAKHAAFASFFTHVAAHARAVRPGLRVGFAVSAPGLVAGRERFASAWAAADVVAVDVVPVDAAAQVKDPSAVGAELDAVVAAAPLGKPLLVRRLGYPSAAACGSDEAKQAAFVGAAFAAWDRHASRIPLVVFHELDDPPAEVAAAAAARAGRSDPAFLALVRSTGLRDESGRRKPAHDALLREARVRGF